MLHHLADLLSSEEFMPHGMCFLWRPELIRLHAVADGLIALAYYSIPFALLYFVLRRRDLAFPGVFLLFGAFILACGTTHLLGIWTLWNPAYWLDGGVKLATAAVSVLSAVVVWRVMPAALALPSNGQLEVANRALARQIEERSRAEESVRRLNQELERRVAERTAELEASNARLRAALTEKEVLLREIHHRVKNNLQVVSGLLSLHARNAPPALGQYFRESLERIHAMGRVHEQLYRADDASSLELKSLIGNICENLARIYGAAGERVTCRIEARRPVHVAFETATPVALIVNEVLSNAFKHAFPDGRRGRIVVTVDESETATLLEIRDDGVGLPPDHETRQQRSMGLRLIQLLTRQLDAALRWQSGDGTLFSLAVPSPQGNI
jgi:two-component sensor histidine kinase